MSNNIEWRDLPGWEDHYKISNTGIWSKWYRKELSLCKSKKGYVVVTLSNPSLRTFLHRLLAITFIPNPDNLPCVLHKDDNKDNNSIDNLYWGTNDQNVQDKVRNKKTTYGTKNGRSILTEDQVLYIRENYIKGTRYVLGNRKELADQFGISLGTMSAVVNGTNWKHLLPNK